MAAKATSLVFLQYLTTVFDSIQDAILLIDVEPGDTYRLLLANEGFARTSGYPKSSVGQEIKDIVPAESYKVLLKRYQEVISTRQPVEYAAWFDVPLGRKAFEVNLIPILNAVGECVQIAAITRDVTELQTLREQLATTADTLEQLVKHLHKNV